MSILNETQAQISDAIERTDNQEVIKELGRADLALKAISERESEDKVSESASAHIGELKQLISSTPQLADIKKSVSGLMSYLQKAHGVVQTGHYKQVWMALGLAAFGIPLGVAFGLLLQNMAFIGLGLPIGLGIGLGVGASLDKKAAEEGRVLQSSS